MWWDKPIYIAKRMGVSSDDCGNEIVLYDEPQKLYANVQPISGHTEVMAYGERVFQMYRAMLPLDKWYGEFNEGDKAYLDGKTPEGETVHGEFANYRIASVRNQALRIAIYFEKLQKGVGS